MSAAIGCYRGHMMASLARRQRVFVVLATFLGTWLLGSVYAVASPVGTSPDEPDHWRYAYSVYMGQDASDGWLEVPVSLAGFPATCIAGQPYTNAACVPVLTENLEITPVGTALYGAPILYYGLVGWPLTQWADERGIIVSRVLSALFSAILWALAILPWAKERRHWPARLAIVLTATPAALYFSGTIQPSGMEIAAFAALWSLSLVVFGHLRRGPYRTLPGWIQLAWPLLAASAIFIRFASAWFVAIVLFVVWLWSAVPLGRLLRDYRVVGAAVLVAGAAAVRTVSFLSDRSTGIFGVGLDTPPEVSVIGRVVALAARLTRDPERAVGLMGWFDTQVPSMGTMLWFLLAGGIAFLAIPLLGRRDLVAYGALFAVLGATAFVLEIAVTMSSGNEFWQPRYGFPIWMGVPLLMAATLAARTATSSFVAGSLLRWACTLSLGVMHLVSVAYLMARYMYGIVGFGSVGELGWTPYVQTTLVVAIAILGAALLSLTALPEGSDAEVLESEDLGVRTLRPAST